MKKALLSIATMLLLATTSSISVSAGETRSDEIKIKFNQPETLEFTLSDNVIKFNDIVPIIDLELDTGLTATVKSSSAYDIKVKGESDLTGVNNNLTIPIEKLGIKVNDKDGIVLSPEYKDLILNESATEERVYDIDFSLAKTSGYTLDTYKTDLKFIVIQK